MFPSFYVDTVSQGSFDNISNENFIIATLYVSLSSIFDIMLLLLDLVMWKSYYDIVVIFQSPLYR